MTTYLIVTMRISTHRISDSTPMVALANIETAMGGGVDRFLESVQRAGTDIAKHDADGTDRQRPVILMMMSVGRALIGA